MYKKIKESMIIINSIRYILDSGKANLASLHDPTVSVSRSEDIPCKQQIHHDKYTCGAELNVGNIEF